MQDKDITKVEKLQIKKGNAVRIAKALGWSLTTIMNHSSGELGYTTIYTEIKAANEELIELDHKKAESNARKKIRKNYTKV